MNASKDVNYGLYFKIFSQFHDTLGECILKEFLKYCE